MIQVENKELFRYQTNTKILLTLAVGSLSTELLLYPIDRIKTRLFSRSQFTTKSPFGVKEAISIFRDIIRIDGRNGLYYGFTASIDRALTLNISRFFTFWYGYVISKGNENLSLLIAVNLCGLLTQPSNLTKILAQTEPLGTTNVRVKWSEKLQSLWNAQGNPKGFIWRPGFGSHLLLSNLFAISEVLIFRKMKTLYINPEQGDGMESDTENQGKSIIFA